MFHYNKLNDNILNWNGVKFPTGNRDIDRFEENNKQVSINVFEPDDCLKDNKIILPGKILSERAFSAFGGFYIAKNDGIYTGLCAFPAQNPVHCDGFGLCTLQSGHKTP